MVICRSLFDGGRYGSHRTPPSDPWRAIGSYVQTLPQSFLAFCGNYGDSCSVFNPVHSRIVPHAGQRHGRRETLADVNIKFEQVDAKVFVGKDLDDAIGFQLAIGPAGEVYREAGKLAEERHNEIAAALRTQLAKYQGPNGVMMDSSSWKVTANNPG